jgi:hypothetical protein
MQDKPDVVDLLAAVTSFLRDEVAPALGGRLGLQARIAANCLGIVRRELLHATADEAAEGARLEKLVGASGSLPELNEELCRRISQRLLGLDDEPLIDHLWQTTICKIRIDQPEYATYVRMAGEQRPASE